MSMSTKIYLALSGIIALINVALGQDVVAIIVMIYGGSYAIAMTIGEKK